ncbi:g10892 [Coccomyxa elongata]
MAAWFRAQPEWFKSGSSATAVLVTVSAIHSRMRRALVLHRLHIGWCPRTCFTSAMADSLRKRPGFYVERKEDASAIRQLLSPDRDASGFFYILTGPAGGGKTTLAQKVIHELREGIIYVAAPSDAGQFGHQLANALQLVEQLPNPLFLVYNYVLNIAGGGEHERSSRLGTCLSALEDAARAFRAARRRPAVLVIDNAERLAAKEAIMRNVLFAAQQWADRGLVRVVFVSSDDTLVTHLLGQSRCSKAASVEMEDLSEPLALQYLEKRGIAAKTAGQVVDVTGGRLLQLMCAVEVLQAGGTSEDVRQLALASAEAEFQNVGLLDDTPQSAAGLRVVQALLRNRDGISSNEWNRLVPSPMDKKELLRGNVFSWRFRDRRIGFENRSVAVYASNKYGGACS